MTTLVILAKVPATRGWQAFDIGVVLLGGLTGPFCIILLPVALSYWYLHRERWRATSILLLGSTSLLQLGALISTSKMARSQAPLGVTPELFLQLVAGRVYMAALWGKLSLAAQQHLLLLLLATLTGTSIVIYSLWKANTELRLLLLFCFVMLGLALSRPMASYVAPQWPILSTGAGHHYWFLPMVAFVWSLLWCSLEADSRWLRTTAKVLALTMPIGVLLDWRYPAYQDMGYPTYARQFALAQAGTSLSIPIFPPGWEMKLSKKSATCSVFPEGFIDTPKSDSTVSAMVPVSGWVIAAGQHIQQISLKVDNRSLPQFRPQVARPDVDSIHPESPDKDKGWSTEFDASALTPGKHQIEVWAAENSGCNTEIAHVTVEVNVERAR